MKKNIIILFLISPLLAACDFEINEPKVVKIEQVEFKSIDNNKIYPGYIERGGTVNLSFRTSGIVEKLYINDGEYAQKGKLLAVLDDEEYKLQIKKAKTSLDDQVVKYERAKSYFERISKLYDAGGISYNEWEAAQTNLKSSINQMSILKDALRIEQDKEKYRKIYAPYNGFAIDVTKSKGEFISAGEIFVIFQDIGKYFIGLTPDNPDALEVFADCFSMAIMYNTPLNKYNPFSMFSEELFIDLEKYFTKIIKTIK